MMKVNCTVVLSAKLEAHLSARSQCAIFLVTHMIFPVLYHDPVNLRRPSDVVTVLVLNFIVVCHMGETLCSTHFQPEGPRGA